MRKMTAKQLAEWRQEQAYLEARRRGDREAIERLQRSLFGSRGSIGDACRDLAAVNAVLREMDRETRRSAPVCREPETVMRCEWCGEDEFEGCFCD
jgi:hypothetical protein